MTDKYSHSVVRLAVANICKSLGWEAITSSCLEILVDSTERHMKMLGLKSHRYAEQFGRVDGTIDDVGMAFLESGLNVLEIGDYMKNIEPIKLGQPVADYPLPSEDSLIFPEYMESEQDGEATFHINHDVSSPIDNASLEATASPLPSQSISEFSPSPLRTPGRLRDMSDRSVSPSVRFRKAITLDDHGLEQGALSDILNQARGPGCRKPPKPHNLSQNTLKVEPLKISQASEKLASVHVDVESDPKVRKSTSKLSKHSGEPKNSKSKEQRASKKQKKKQTVAPQPEGFSIFGEVLEKPVTSKSSLNRRLSVSLENVAVEPEPEPEAVASEVESELSISVTPEPNLNDPQVRARMDRMDDTIESVLSYTRDDMEKSERANDAFDFDDRPVTPVENKVKSLKVNKPPKKKSVSPKPKKDGKLNQEELDSSYSPPPKKLKSREKKMPRSEPQSLLEAFAEAPLESVTVDLKSADSEPEVIEAYEIEDGPAPEPDALSGSVEASEDSMSVSRASSEDVTMEVQISVPRASDDVSPVPKPFTKDEIVNVDEDSDVDILEASSPTPPLLNPYAAYSPLVLESAGPPSAARDPPRDLSPLAQPRTPTLDLSYVPEPNYGPPDDRAGYAGSGSELTREDNDSRTTSRGSHSQVGVEWEVYQSPNADRGESPDGAHNDEDQEETIHWDEGNTVDLSQYPLLPGKHKKDKHKKEKKEKKEKKKKKNKDKDKEEKHKHRKERHSSRSTPVELEVPKLTLKLPPEPEPEPEPTIPKLVIKPPVQTYTSYSEGTEIVSHTMSVESVPVVAPDDKIWICPGCSQPDDGSPMIGCDKCDEWFHWPCVGIVAQPADDENWFCPSCLKKEKGKRRKKKTKERR